MKAFLDDYLKTIMYTVCGILLVLGSYNILININHYSFINKKIVVSDLDNSYKSFKSNILEIEENLSSFQGDKSNILYVKTKNTLNVLKKDGVYQLLPGSTIGYKELYNLNMYYLDVVINTGWISNLKDVVNNSDYNEMVNHLVNDANYVHKELLNNSNFHYDVKNNPVRNGINDEYNFILSNYQSFSKIILNISKRLGD